VAAVPDVDVVVVTRGGGSIEDLWAFNEEVVARAIAACPVPVVSAVGHEVDFTIADFVADRRVPTPTAAAELLAPVKDELRADLLSREGRVKRAFGRELERRRALAQALGARVADPRRLIGERRMRLDALEDRALKPLRAELKRRREALDAVTQRLLRAHPRAHIGEVRRRVALLLDRLSLGARRAVTQRKAREAGLAGRLEAMSPLAVLARGYSVTFRERDGHALRRHDEVAPGEKVRVRLAEGELSAEVTAARPPVDPSSSGG
jgi:exodeoxyribonuclease VII large subunit